MKIIKGDLIKLALQGEFDVIVHGCNCFCTMGAGIAKSIKPRTTPLSSTLGLRLRSAAVAGEPQRICLPQRAKEIAGVSGF